MARKKFENRIELEPATNLARIYLDDDETFAVVDAADLDQLKQYTWRMVVGKRITYAGTQEVRIDGSKLRLAMHQVLTNPPLGMVVDHINHDGLDNRRSNLRICTPRQNTQNKRKTNSPRSASKWKGVSWQPQGRNNWFARFYLSRKECISLGSHQHEADAAQAYNFAAARHQGEFACLNQAEQTCPWVREVLGL